MDKTIAIRKSVYAAAQKLVKEAESNAGASPAHLAEKKIDECQAARNHAEALFWRAVWTHLVLDQESNEIQIIEDD